MMNMQFSLIHPSRGRVEIARQTIELWLNNADDKSNIEYILSVDVTDPHLRRYKQLAMDLGINIHIAMNKSAIEAINRATKKSVGRIIIVVSDDFLCEQGWDTSLLNELEGKEDYLVKTRDGIQPTLVTLPLLDRKYYNRFGYVYQPEFQHLFSDQEMTAVAMMLGRLIKSDLFFEHIHYSTGKFQKDEISERNDKSWNQGKKVFNQHLKTNFGIENPVMKYSDIKWQ
jgi:hypothetical protein